MHTKTITELLYLLNTKQCSCVELTELFLQRIKNKNPEINAFISLSETMALEQAKVEDAKRAKGQASFLSGIPIAHKDLFCTHGIKTSCGSKMLDNFIAPYDATLVKKLKSAGTVLLGKTNMDEFAMGSSNETSYYGPVRNPWDLSRVPGGSSGGSAAAIAARLVPGTTGSDTGGSIRQPAALCGITGLKPTYGRVSRFGMVAFASSLDQAGPMAQTAEDCALLLEAMAGFDPKDSTSIEHPVPRYHQTLTQPIAGITVGIPKEFFQDGLPPKVQQAIEEAMAQLKKLGVHFKEISLPNTRLAISTYYIIAPAEASSNLSRFDGIRFGHQCKDPTNLQDLYTRSRSEGFGNEVKCRILMGTYVLSAGFFDAYYLKAQKVRNLIRQDFQNAFQEVDIILGPTTPEPAFLLGSKNNDPISMYLCDIYTISVNLAGLPALSMPGGFIDQQPIGIQLIGDLFQEDKLLNIAHQFQQVTDWHKRVPVAFLE